MFFFFFFFLNDTAPTEIYPLPLHDALPIWRIDHTASLTNGPPRTAETTARAAMMPSVTTLIGSHTTRDRKSTRLNSSHSQISYAVFCLKKKKKENAYKKDQEATRTCVTIAE